jgi:hypothetical protein
MHFTVLVIGDDFESQLEPFWELDLPKETIKDDYRAEFHSDVVKEILEEDFIKYKQELKRDWVDKVVPLEDDYNTLDEYALIQHGYYFDEKTNSYGYYLNPNSRWDWFTVGGRWTGYFKLKEGRTGDIGQPGTGNNKPIEGYVDIVRKGDIDFEGMTKDSIETAKRSWEEAKSEKDKAMKNFSYGIEENDTEETYIKRMSNFKPNSILYNGEWIEDMLDREFKELIERIPNNTILTIVDCHI